MIGRVGDDGADGIGGMAVLGPECLPGLHKRLRQGAQHTVIAQIQACRVDALRTQQVARQSYARMGQAYVLRRILRSLSIELALGQHLICGAAIRSETGQSGLAMRCTNELLAPFSSKRRTR